MPFEQVYSPYQTKVERKGRTKKELDEVICWLTGFSEEQLQEQVQLESTFTEFFDSAKLNQNASLITGAICGVKVEEIEDPLMQKIRYMDKVVDELFKGKAMEKILR